jgi:hypothetical protein
MPSEQTDRRVHILVESVSVFGVQILYWTPIALAMVVIAVLVNARTK